MNSGKQNGALSQPAQYLISSSPLLCSSMSSLHAEYTPCRPRVPNLNSQIPVTAILGRACRYNPVVDVSAWPCRQPGRPPGLLSTSERCLDRSAPQNGAHGVSRLKNRVGGVRRTPPTL